MITLGAFEAKTHLSQLLERIERGEEFIITRYGKPVARLIRCNDGGNSVLDQTISQLRELRDGEAEKHP